MYDTDKAEMYLDGTEFGGLTSPKFQIYCSQAKRSAMAEGTGMVVCALG